MTVLLIVAACLAFCFVSTVSFALGRRSACALRDAGRFSGFAEGREEGARQAWATMQRRA